MYDPRTNGRRHSFGVSGLLYRRNLLLYDHETESLWSQLLGQAVTGPLAGTALRLLPSLQTTWSAWKQRHPGTLALSFQTGYSRDYSRDPYESLPLNRSPAVVVRTGSATKIYPFSELKKLPSPVSDELAGVKLSIEFDARQKVAVVRREDGSLVSSFISFFGDARAFYPNAPVFKAR